jgi:hypothetical protein
MRQTYDQTCSAGNEPEEYELAARFGEARAHICNAIRRAERDGISGDALAFALMSEALPRIVHEHGPAWAAEMLAKLADRIGAGLV